jgi:hypothetical protein
MVSTIDKFAVNLLLNLKSTIIPKKIINVIIFDWDDTLFPTEYFKTRIDMLYNHKLIPDEINLKLRTLASDIIKLITCAKLCGNVLIISNAKSEWLTLCFQVIPEIIPILNTINIISAQDNFIHLSNDPAKWKEYAFYYNIFHTIKIYDNFIHNYNLISIGDSIHERDALKISAKYIKTYNPNSIFTKTIKLLDKPTFEKVIIQLQILFHIFFKIEDLSYLGDEDFDFP